MLEGAIFQKHCISSSFYDIITMYRICLIDDVILSEVYGLSVAVEPV